MINFFRTSLVNIFSKILVRILRITLGRFGNWPYLSQKNFRNLADFEILDAHKIETISRLRASQILFINSDQLDSVLEKHFHDISASVLITGNSDANMTHMRILPKSVKLWLSQNSTLPQSLSHRTIPIGIEDASFGRLGLKFHYQFVGGHRKQKVFVPAMSPTNEVRVITRKLTTNEIFEVSDTYLNPFQYSKKIRAFQFTLCLEGNGFENHRIWETLYLNAFPVMLRTSFSENLKSLGLPILLIDDIQDVSLKLLSSHATDNSDFRAAHFNLLWMPYWKNLISHFIQEI